MFLAFGYVHSLSAALIVASGMLQKSEGERSYNGYYNDQHQTNDSDYFSFKMYAPFFESPPSLVFKPDGSVLFECICSGNPQPTIQWFFKGQELKGDRFVPKIKKSVGKWTVTLIMKNPTQEDQGVYKVVATNSAGTHSVEQQYVHSQTANEIFKTQ